MLRVLRVKIIIFTPFVDYALATPKINHFSNWAIVLENEFFQLSQISESIEIITYISFNRFSENFNLKTYIQYSILTCRIPKDQNNIIFLDFIIHSYHASNNQYKNKSNRTTSIF